MANDVKQVNGVKRISAAFQGMSQPAWIILCMECDRPLYDECFFDYASIQNVISEQRLCQTCQK